MATTKAQARRALRQTAHAAGERGRPLDVAWVLAGMGNKAGLGDRFDLHRELAWEWAAGLRAKQTAELH